jgi:hypothetical protein
MPPRPRRLDPGIPIERFALALRDLHREAGRPKQRILAASLHCSHATVSAILNGHRFPSWEQTEAFVLICGGDVRAWKRRWTQADRDVNAEPGTAGPPAPAPSSLRLLSGSGFYKAMLAEVNRAKFRIMTTFIRHRPPAYFLGFTDEETARAASAYFDGIIAWSDLPGPRSLRRIICTPNREMEDWARRFVRETAARTRHEIRIVDWPFAADAVNMAIFDDSVAFLAFTAGAAQQLNGFRIDDPAFVRCSIGYFEQLWAEARKPADTGGRHDR